MNRTPQEILDWLLQHCDRDRVFYNALCNHKRKPVAWHPLGAEHWLVDAESKTGKPYRVHVNVNPVGEPVSWHRL